MINFLLIFFMYAICFFIRSTNCKDFNKLEYGKSYIGFANKLVSKRLFADYQYVRCTFFKSKLSVKRQKRFPFLYRNANFIS